MIDTTQTIADAEAFARCHGQRVVIILASDGSNDILVTYGASTVDSDHAAMIGDLFRRFQGWEVEIPATTARVEALAALVMDTYEEGVQDAFDNSMNAAHWQEGDFGKSKAKVKLEAILASTGRVDAAKRLLDALTDDERSDLFGDYCKACGSNNPACRCWDDS